VLGLADLGHRSGDAGGPGYLQAPGPGLVTPEVFERTFGLLADLYQEQ
jgi:hypothetical protein